MPDVIRVMHLITSLSLGGAQTALSRLVIGLNGVRIASSAVSMTEVGPLGERLQAQGVPVHVLGMRRGQPSPAGLIKLVRLLRRERPHILQTWLYHADLFGLLAAQLAHLPLVVWNVRASNMDMTHYRRLSGWTVKACTWLSGIPKTVVVNSEAGRAFHVQIGYHPQRWVLIPNGVDLHKFRPDPALRADVRRELGLESNALLVGLLARFDPMKDHATFLRAAGLLARTEPAVHFLLAGERMTHDNVALSEMIIQEKLEAQVHLLGLRPDPPRLMAALDIFALSSVSEGFPNVVAEAMACGVPGVVTNVGDSASIVAETGVVVPPRDPTTLAEGWRTLIALGAQGRQQLGRAASERVRRHYSLEAMVQRYEDLYLSLVECPECVE